MDKNVTMKILTYTVGLVITLIGTVYALTVSSQGDFNSRIESRVDDIYETVNQNQETIIRELGKITETTGRIDERLKNIERTR